MLIGLVAPLLTAFLAAILVLMVIACALGVSRTRELIPALRSAPGMTATLLLQNGLLALLAWRLARNRELPVRAWLRLQPARIGGVGILALLVLAVGVFALGALAALASRQLGLPADARMADRIVTVFQNAPGISWLALVLAMGIGPGFGEEIWARGHLLRALELRWRTRWAIVVSALLFALLHLDPTHIVFALPFGFVLGWLTVRTDSILPGILCHAFVNSGVNLLRAIEVRKPGYSDRLAPQVIQPAEVWSMVALVAAGLAAGWWIEHRFRRLGEPGSTEAAAGATPP